MSIKKPELGLDGIMKTTAKIPVDLWKATKHLCVEKNMDLAEAINEGLEEWVKKNKQAKGKA